MAGSEGIGFFGAGQIEITASEVILRGTRRLWFLVPIYAELRLDRREIGDATAQGEQCAFGQARFGKHQRRWTLVAADPGQAAAIAERLGATPARAADDSPWQQLAELQRQLDAHTPRTVVTTVLVAANVAAYGAMAAMGAGFFAANPFMLTEWGSNFGAATVTGEWWRLLSSMFIHFGVLHLLLNMWVLWDIGRLVERLYGNLRFLLIYLASGLTGSVLTIFWDPLRNSAGASGAICGVLGAFLAVLLWRKDTIPVIVRRSYRLGIIAFLGFNLLAGVFSTGTDNVAHVGGALAGLILGAVLAPYRLRSNSEAAAPQRTLSPHVGLPLLLLATMGACGVWALQSAAARVPVTHRYWATHTWYAKDEAEVLARMNVLDVRMQSGTISPAEVAQTVRKDILPFWISADERLLAEADSEDDLLFDFSVSVANYTKLRRETFESLLDAATNQDQGAFLDAAERRRQAENAGIRLQDLVFRERAASPSALWRRNPAARRLAAGVASTFHRCRGQPASERSTLDAKWMRGDGPYELAAAGCRAQRAFVGEDFETLDAWLSAADPPISYGDGSWEISGLLHGLGELIGESRNWETNLSRVFEWQRRLPDSKTALAIEVLLYKERGWDARGGGLGDTVAPAGWLLYEYTLKQALEMLSGDGLKDWVSPVRYKLALDLGTDMSAQWGAQYALYDEAIANYPAFLSVHRSMLRYLLPRWHGSVEDVDALVEHAVRQTRDLLGNEMYARLYSALAEYEGPEFDLFGKSAARWDTMKSGFEDMLSRYPHSLAVLNDYANCACRAEDHRTFAALRARIGEHIYPASWPKGHTIKECETRAGTVQAP